MLYSETFRRGAALNRRTAKRDPLALMADLRESNPALSRDTIIKKWKEKCRSDDQFDDAVYDYAATNMWTSLSRRNQPSADGREEIKNQRKQAADKIAKEVRSIIIMELLSPNGKRWGDCTFAEVRKLGKAGMRISKLGKPNQIIRNVLSEEDLRREFGVARS